MSCSFLFPTPLVFTAPCSHPGTNTTCETVQLDCPVPVATTQEVNLLPQRLVAEGLAVLICPSYGLWGEDIQG